MKQNPEDFISLVIILIFPRRPREIPDCFRRCEEGLDSAGGEGDQEGVSGGGGGGQGEDQHQHGGEAKEAEKVGAGESRL